MPARDLAAGITAVLGDRVVYPALFFEGTFWSVGQQEEQLVNLWSGLGTFSWDGKSWLGAGNLIGISGIEESNEPRAIGFSVSLNGQNSASISLLKQGMRQGKPGKIWLGFLTQAGALVGDPYLLKQGKLNVGFIQDTGADCKITVSYEDRLIDLERPRARRNTHEQQRVYVPADRGFELVPSLQDMQIFWGRA